MNIFNFLGLDWLEKLEFLSLVLYEALNISNFSNQSKPKKLKMFISNQITLLVYIDV